MHELNHSSLPDPTEPRSVKLRLKRVSLHTGERTKTEYLSFQWHIVGTKDWIYTYVPLSRPSTRWAIREHAEALKKWFEPYPTSAKEVLPYFKQYIGKECYGTLRWRSPWWELRGLRHKRTGLLGNAQDD